MQIYFFNSSIEVETEVIHFINLLEIYIKRVQTLFGNIKKKSRGKYYQILLVIEVRSFFQFVGVIGKQGVVVVTQRLFYHEKQILKISQGTVGEDESALRILCLHKI